MPTAAQRTDHRRASILDAARRLLVRKGYQDIVLDDLALEAKVAKGTLFLYFKSKDELLSATFAELVDQLGTALEAAGESGAARPLEAAVEIILAYFDRNSDFLAQFGAGRFPSCGDRSCGRLMEKFSRNVKTLAGLLQDDARLEGYRLADASASAVALFGLCRSAFLYKRLTGKARGTEASKKWVLETFLFGVRGRR